VQLPDNFAHGCNLFTGEDLAAQDATARLALAFAHFPFAVLVAPM
jgi:hypothetical protein